MDRRARLRRTGLLCLHTLRNLAFYAVMVDTRQSWERGQFWITSHNNFLDIAILEWCKMFTDRNGMHHWRKTVTDTQAFEEQILKSVGSNQEAYDQYAISLKRYRDKFVAHLDELNTITIPHMTMARLSTQALYRWISRNEDDCNAFHDAPPRAEDFYWESVEHARQALRGEA